ncbi:MAG: glycosyltransferase family 2 protein [Candidatus Nanopelagicales bacterium]
MSASGHEDIGEVPDVDVVVPTRDRPELLRQCVRAILNQEYAGPIRVLVVYDQSEVDQDLVNATDIGVDGTSRRLEVLANTRTPGLAGARNTGIEAANAELVAFCDDDDQWLPGKLQRQVDALSHDPGAEFVCCGIEVAYDDSVHVRVLTRHQITLRDLLRDRLTELHPSTFLMRRKAVIDGFGLVEENIPGSYAEDYEFLLRAARQHIIANVPHVGVRVLWSKGSYFTARWETMRTALQWLLERYPEFHQVRAGEARVFGQIAFASAAEGRGKDAWRWAGRTIRRNPTEARAYLALGVATKLLKPDTVLRRLHQSGRGI